MAAVAQKNACQTLCEISQITSYSALHSLFLKKILAAPALEEFPAAVMSRCDLWQKLSRPASDPDP